MSRFLVIASALLAVCVVASSVEDRFAAFKTQYKKSYATTEREQRALEAFRANLAVIDDAQRYNPEAQFGITKFADMTQAEFVAFLRRSISSKPRTSDSQLPKMNDNAAVPSSLNWVTRGAVTPVVDQGECGNDWAFAAVENIEGVNFVQNGVLTALSVEELTVCDDKDQGCDGGFMTNAYEWLLQKQGGNIMTALSWPYAEGTSNCTYVGKTVGATITGYQEIPKSETEITTYVATYGPVAAAVDATSWQFYISGILTNCTFSQVDHGIAVVGYDNSASTPYWIIKNSWGEAWGMSGYIWIQKGVNACGINQMASTAFAQKYI